MRALVWKLFPSISIQTIWEMWSGRIVNRLVWENPCKKFRNYFVLGNNFVGTCDPPKSLDPQSLFHWFKVNRGNTFKIFCSQIFVSLWWNRNSMEYKSDTLYIFDSSSLYSWKLQNCSNRLLFDEGEKACKYFCRQEWRAFNLQTVQRNSNNSRCSVQLSPNDKETKLWKVEKVKQLPKFNGRIGKLFSKEFDEGRKGHKNNWRGLLLVRTYFSSYLLNKTFLFVHQVWALS